MRHCTTYLFLSTLSLRRATTLGAAPPAPQGISIHALLTESDRAIIIDNGRLPIFLSTLSLRRATINSRFLLHLLFHFYPRSPYGERRRSPQATVHTWKFLSTLSLRRATSTVDSCSVCSSISIHALLTESDLCRETQHFSHFRFLSTLSLRRATFLFMYPK